MAGLPVRREGRRVLGRARRRRNRYPRAGTTTAGRGGVRRVLILRILVARLLQSVRRARCTAFASGAGERTAEAVRVEGSTMTQPLRIAFTDFPGDGTPYAIVELLT